MRAGVLRARDRHHAHPPGGHARLRSVPPRRRRGRPVARADRFLQLRRGVPAQARDRDVRAHQAQLSAHLSLHEHERAGVQRGSGQAAGAVGDRRGHVLDRWRHGRRATPSTGRRGDFEKAIRNLRFAADEKRATGSDLPFLNWRYILFTHNDSDAEMAQARAMAADIGVDRLCWELTDHPEEMFSRRFRAGLARAGGDQARKSGTTTTSATPSPARRPARRSTSARAEPWRQPSADSRASPVDGAAGPPGADRCTVRNLSTGAFPAQASYGRRLVRLGAQLCDRNRTVINRDFERAWLPAHAAPGAVRRRCR